MNGNRKFKAFVAKSTVKGRRRPLFDEIGKDVPAGIVVFLVALPLCLGIALASGAPLISGLISGIIGGLVIGMLSQSDTSVSGPAASLTAVVFVAIQRLGTFEVFLLALLIGGILQCLLGILRAGLLADYMPTSIIKGLLAAIGLILIFSQIPYALGVESNSRLVDYSRNFMLESPDTLLLVLNSFSPGAIVLSLISLAILVGWDKTFLKKIKFIPPSLFVVFLGVVLNMVFKFSIPDLYLEGAHLVNIPAVSGLTSFLIFPDFSAIGNFQVWIYAFTIAIVASVVTLLNLEATDNLDPHKRRSPPNRELVAQGIGNMIAGFIGGIPITSVIVRSSVNIEAGAETKLSTLIHGVLLLLSVVLLSAVINLIPLASLAAILLVVGYKLASFSIFKNMYQKGWEQFIPFIVTAFAILITDVLIGVLIGSAFSVFFLLRGNFYNPFYLESTRTVKGNSFRIELSNEVSFLNKPAIKSTLWGLPENSKIVIDASFTTYVERDIIEILQDFQNTFARENNIEVTITGLKTDYGKNKEDQLIWVQPVSKPKLTTPQEILDYLKSGNQKYAQGNLVSRRLRNKELMDFIKDAPLAVVINCIDMREPLNMLLNTGIGDLIPLKAAGNLVGEHLIHSVEVACRKQGAKLILIMGNSENSFIKEARETHLQGIPSYLDPLIAPALSSATFEGDQNFKNKGINVVDEIILWNLKESEKRILAQNDYISEQVTAGNLGLCTAFFNRKTGNIQFSELYRPRIIID